VSIQSKGPILQDVTEIENVKYEGKVWGSQNGVGENSGLLENYIISTGKQVLVPQRSLLLSCSWSMQSKKKQKLEAARPSKYQ
jgi:hypothetical protein